ncbi:hypothetical protein LY76DRAFT_192393 [Colletotrichum caudatum]|nr:hypothetical protein LY76DRAFT_192393 [Colletotrichum caudatum]
MSQPIKHTWLGGRNVTAACVHAWPAWKSGRNPQKARPQQQPTTTTTTTTTTSAARSHHIPLLRSPSVSVSVGGQSTSPEVDLDGSGSCEARLSFLRKGSKRANMSRPSKVKQTRQRTPASKQKCTLLLLSNLDLFLLVRFWREARQTHNPTNLQRVGSRVPQLVALHAAAAAAAAVAHRYSAWRLSRLRNHDGPNQRDLQAHCRKRSLDGMVLRPRRTRGPSPICVEIFTVLGHRVLCLSPEPVLLRVRAY